MLIALLILSLAALSLLVIVLITDIELLKQIRYLNDELGVSEKPPDTDDPLTRD